MRIPLGNPSQSDRGAEQEQMLGYIPRRQNANPLESRALQAGTQAVRVEQDQVPGNFQAAPGSAEDFVSRAVDIRSLEPDAATGPQYPPTVPQRVDRIRHVFDHVTECHNIEESIITSVQVVE